MANNKLVQKSVRMPAEMVDYIEQQEGDTFSEKLIGVVYEYWNGDRERREKLAKYDRDVQARESRLEEILARIYEASWVLRSCADVLKKSKIIIEEQDKTI